MDHLYHGYVSHNQRLVLNICGFFGGWMCCTAPPSSAFASRFAKATWSLRSACGRWCRAVDAGASPHPWTGDLGAFSGPGGTRRAWRLLFWASKGVPFLDWLTGQTSCRKSRNHGSSESWWCWTDFCLKWSSKIINLCRTALSSSGSQGWPTLHAKLQEVR